MRQGVVVVYAVRQLRHSLHVWQEVRVGMWGPEETQHCPKHELLPATQCAALQSGCRAPTASASALPHSGGVLLDAQQPHPAAANAIWPCPYVQDMPWLCGAA